VLPPSTHVSGGVYLDEITHPLFETKLAPMPGMARPAGDVIERHQCGDRATDWAALLAGVAGGRAPRHSDADCRPSARQAAPAGRSRGDPPRLRCPRTRPCRPAEVSASCATWPRRTPSASSLSSPSPRATGSALVSVGELLDEPTSSTHGSCTAGCPRRAVAVAEASRRPASRPVRAAWRWRSLGRALARLRYHARAGDLSRAGGEARRGARPLRALGATAEDPILIRCSSAPQDARERLRREAERRRPALIIVDPLFQVHPLEDATTTPS